MDGIIEKPIQTKTNKRTKLLERNKSIEASENWVYSKLDKFPLIIIWPSVAFGHFSRFTSAKPQVWKAFNDKSCLIFRLFIWASHTQTQTHAHTLTRQHNREPLVWFDRAEMCLLIEPFVISAKMFKMFIGSFMLFRSSPHRGYCFRSFGFCF